MFHIYNYIEWSFNLKTKNTCKLSMKTIFCFFWKSQLKYFAGTGDWTWVCNSQSCLWLALHSIVLNSIDADMKSEIGCSRGGLRPYPLRFHVVEVGADAKLIQHGPLGVAYYHRHPISGVPVERITAHTTVPGFVFSISFWSLLAHIIF